MSDCLFCWRYEAVIDLSLSDFVLSGPEDTEAISGLGFWVNHSDTSHIVGELMYVEEGEERFPVTQPE